MAWASAKRSTVSNESQQGGNGGGQAKGVSGAVVAAIVAGVLFLIILFAGITSVTTYNGLVNRVEAADEAWGQVETAYQRRADLVPNLVDSVERFMEHERETLESVTEAREGEPLSKQLEALKAARQSAQAERASAPTRAETLAKLKGSQQQLSERMTALMARFEAYPQLRSSDQFMRLQAQLEGAENRISVARQRYNQAVSDLNSALQRIPGRWIGQFAGFEPRAYFEADEGAADAPSVAE